MHKIYYFIVIFFLGISSQYSQASSGDSTYVNKKFLSTKVQTLYSNKNSDIENEANYIAQTPDGAIWIAAYAGLFHFDGKRFSMITEEDYPIFDSSSSRCLYVSKDGTLWIGSNDSGLFSLKDGVMSHYESQEGLSSSIRGIFSDTNNIYVMTTNGLGKVTDDVIERVTHSSVTGNFLSGTVGENGLIFLVDTNGNLISISSSGENHQLVNVEGKKLQAVLFEKQDGLYVVTEDEYVYLLSNDGQEVKSRIKLPDLGQIYSLYIDKEKRVWICANDGLGFIDQDDLFHKLPLNKQFYAYKMVTQDYEGNIWVAINTGGVIKFSASKFTDIFFDNEIVNDGVNASLIDDDKLYIGTDHGLIIIGKNGRQDNSLTKTMKSQRIRYLYLDTQGNLWICSYQNGLYRTKQGEITGHWIKDNGLPSDKVRTVVEGGDGTIYVGTVAGIASIKNNTVIKTYTSENGIKTDFILNLKVTDNFLLAGTDGGGLYKINLQSGDMANISKEHKIGVILRMAIDEQTGITFITSGRLHIILPDGKIKKISKHIIDGDIYDIKIFNRKLVLIASKGVYLADIEDVMSKEVIPFDKLNVSDGLFSIPTPNAWNFMDPDGMLYVCTREGVFFIDLNNIHPKNTPLPRIGINKILVDSEEVAIKSIVHIPVGVHKIDLVLSVFSFNNAEKNRLNYQLKGFDPLKSTVKLEDDTTVSYTNLDGGHYTFYFTGVNSDNIESIEPIEIQIHKELALSEQPEAYLFLIICFILVTFIWVSLWIRRREKRLIIERNAYREVIAEAIKVISLTIDAKDYYTHGHSQRVADYSVLIAQELGFKEKKLEELYYTSLLHDIGKISIPDLILNKQDKLTANELEIMHSHSIKGYEMLQSFKHSDYIWMGALYHHEHYDGTGYPSQIEGADIPLIGRIISVADSYDAMVTDRPYRLGLPQEVAIEELIKGKESQFDAQIVDIMVNLINNGNLFEVAEKTPTDV